MKKLPLLLLIVLLSTAAGAQEVYNSSGSRGPSTRQQRKGGFDPQKLIFGGNFGGGLSGNSYSVTLAPIVGYRFTERFAAGVGLGFQYYKENDFFAVTNNSGYIDYYPLKSTFIYPSVWARYLITDNIFAHVEGEYDVQNFKVYDIDYNVSSPNYGQLTSEKISYKSPALLIGGGYRQPISERSSFVVMALYDVLQDKYSPYKGINLRFGINAGF